MKVFSDRTSWSLTPNRLSLTLEEFRKSGRPLLDLTASNPTVVGLNYESKMIAEALRNDAALIYTPDPRGLSSAREEVRKYYEELSWGGVVDPEDIILTTSTSEAYSFAFRLLCNPGDEVLIPTPSYPLFEFLAQLQDVQLRPFELIYDHGWEIDFHSLERAIQEKTRAIILVNLNNPTGSFVKSHESEMLNRLAEQHSLALIVDEVFLDYGLNDRSVRSFAFNEGALTLTLSGLSKIAGLPQMKFAWMAVSGSQIAKVEALSRLEVIADTYLSMNAPVQHAAGAMFASRHGIQRQIVERIRRNLVELDRLIGSQKVCSRLDLEGGWYAIVRIPAVESDEDAAIKLLQRHGVLVHPGHFFDFHSDGYLVVSLIAPEEEFKEGVRGILDMAGS